MSRLEELIQELCPDGVEYKAIKDVCKSISSGGTPKSTVSYYYDGDIPWVRTQEVDWCDIYDTEIKITEAGLKSSSAKWIPENCLIIAMYGATAAKIAINRIPVTTNQACCNLEPDEGIVILHFLYHYMASQYEILKSLGRGSQSNISAQIIKEYRVPVPPLEIQREIVRILDEYTEKNEALKAQLTAELAARKKQYEYYRDDILDLAGNVTLCRLGDFAEIVRGGNFQKKDFVENGEHCIHYGQMYTHYGPFAEDSLTKVNKEVFEKSKKASHGDVIMAVTSENVEDVCACTAWLGNGEIAVSGHTAIIKHSQNPKFLSYYFRTKHFYKDKIKLAHGTKVIEVTPKSLENVLIPLPSLEKQQQIVDVLDNFNELCNDISEGLPAEIEARQKQYEHYRDKLLTFKEKTYQNEGEH